jgi:hypothetical protein
MTDNKTLILNEFENLKGQFVINDSWNIERLVGIGEDEHDYYYITYNGRKLNWHSCVGRLMPLKGYLQEKDYNELVRIARLNHFDQVTCWVNADPKEAEDFHRRHIKEITEIRGSDKFLTDLHWEMI